MIDRQVDHLVHLVDDLLDVARITRGGLTMRKERCDLVEVVHQVVEANRPMLEESGLTLSLDIPDHPLWMQGDRTRLIQLAGNLLDNARKFTPSDGKVEVSLAEAAGQATFSVRDTGIGIAPDLLPQIFEPFRQLPQTLDRSAGGLGLGLTLVRHIAELHSGEVSAESAGPGRGTILSVRLPLENAAALPAAEDGEVPAAPPQSRRVLLIEDNFLVAESTRMLIEVMGHRVQVALDGRKGLDAARAFHPDVVLCDIGLPGGMDGYAVARAFKQDPALASARLIALSGYSHGESIEQSRAAGFDLYLTKPVRENELEKALTASLVERSAPCSAGQDFCPASTAQE
jgi:CheY-like chemotaxis protein